MKRTKKLTALTLGCAMLIGATLTVSAGQREWLSSSSNCPEPYCKNHTCALYRESDGLGYHYYYCADGHYLN